MDTAVARQDNPFHAGEQAVHERLGIRERMVGLGQRVIRTAMPEQHQRFFEQLPLMLVGSVDGAGRPWASVLVGQPGFVQAPNAKRLDFHVRPIPGDPLCRRLGPGAQLGFLGIELHTRRRNRVNGHVVAHDTGGFSIEVDQSVGNCPQYIQGREFKWVRDAADLRPRGTEALASAGRRCAGTHSALRHPVHRHPGARFRRRCRRGHRPRRRRLASRRAAWFREGRGRPQLPRARLHRQLLLHDAGQPAAQSARRRAVHRLRHRRPAHADRHRRGGVGRRRS